MIVAGPRPLTIHVRRCANLLLVSALPPRYVAPRPGHTRRGTQPRRVLLRQTRQFIVQRLPALHSKVLALATGQKVALLNRARVDPLVEVKVARDDGIEPTGFLSGTSGGITNRASLSTL